MTRGQVVRLTPYQAGRYRVAVLRFGGYAIVDERGRPAYTEGRRTAVIADESTARRILADLFG
jgi:hypothetical protein